GQAHGLTDAQFRAADVNQDGELSVDDAQNILIYYVTNTVSGKNITWEELLGINKPTASLPVLLKRVFHR
ncbi:MAG: hypothetical protein IJM46_07005, partial [Oscillospiraceae bacterium]|nr:hypothetical protein [Oscillospiraceae bacterium]